MKKKLSDERTPGPVRSREDPSHPSHPQGALGRGNVSTTVKSDCQLQD